MQNSGKLSALRSNGSGQEWGGKARKVEAKNRRSSVKAAALRDAKDNG